MPQRMDQSGGLLLMATSAFSLNDKKSSLGCSCRAQAILVQVRRKIAGYPTIMIPTAGN